MTTSEAIENCFDPNVYSAIKGHLSPPELLKRAALLCFMYPSIEGREKNGREYQIQKALIHLEKTGEMLP
jgi:hypothetical protein